MEDAHTGHSLNGVEVLKIVGWPGKIDVQPQPDGVTVVDVWAPRRDKDEFWTWERQKDRVLCLHSALSDSTLASRGADQTLTVRLPADSIGDIEVVKGS